MKVAILGAGALGSAIGGTLAEAGTDVVLLSRDAAHVEAMNREGLRLRGPAGDRLVRVRAALDCAGLAPVDLVVVLVKSYHTDAALREAATLVGPATLVMSLQNGMGHEDILAAAVGRERVLAGKTYVVNFFNSWCIPCHQESAALKAFYDEHKDETDFEMIGMVRDDDEQAIRNYVETQQLEYPVAVKGADKASLDFGTTGQPETYVVNPDGVAVCGTIGPTTQAELNVFLQAARSGQRCA